MRLAVDGAGAPPPASSTLSCVRDANVAFDAAARMARQHTIRPRPMLTEPLEPQLRPWVADPGDPSEDRIMLAIQYATAIIAVFAAGLLSLLH